MKKIQSAFLYFSIEVEFTDYQIPVTQLVQVGPRIFNIFQENR